MCVYADGRCDRGQPFLLLSIAKATLDGDGENRFHQSTEISVELVALPIVAFIRLPGRLGFEGERRETPV